MKFFVNQEGCTDLVTMEYNLREKGDNLKANIENNAKSEVIVNESNEKHHSIVSRKKSEDADTLSRSQKEKKLDNFLREQRHGRRRRKKITVSDVRSEAARILEEFLRAQLQEQSVQTKSPEKSYQRYVEVDITERTTPNGSSDGYLASASNIVREDSIPFIDETDEELRRAESLPHDEFPFSDGGERTEGLVIHHGKSKSAPYENGYDTVLLPQAAGGKAPRGFHPPPPPPPGTPHTPSQESVGRSSSNVPYSGGRYEDSSSMPYSAESLYINKSSPRSSKSSSLRPTPPKVPDSLDLPTSSAASLKHSSHSQSSERERSSTPLSQSDRQGSGSTRSSGSPDKHMLPFRRYKKTGSVSSSDTDYNENKDYFHNRKKKSMFKKAQERLSSILRLKKMQSSPEDADDPGSFGSTQKMKVTKKSKKPKKGKKMSLENAGEDVADICLGGVMEEKHIHINRHIHQTHSGYGSREILRTEDTTEEVEVVSDTERKHTERHIKVKESSTDGKGFVGRLKRMASKDKSKKTRIKGSKSAQQLDPESGAPDYSRTVSVPGGQTGVDSTDYAAGRGYAFSTFDCDHHGQDKHVCTSQVISRGEDIKRHSSHLDIVDHDGTMIERMFFEMDQQDDRLPRNKSFDYIEESHVHERRIKDGKKIRTVRDVSSHDHIDVTEEVEMDGDTEPEDGMKEELYNKIASRLAEIGDNLMTEKSQENIRSASTSPRSKLSQIDKDEADYEPEKTLTKEELSTLEAEIKHELRLVADQMDARLAADARQAAMRIAGLVTYHNFKDVVQESVGNEVGWAQVAAVFNITKRAMQLAGAGGALANQIKENSLRFIEDRFANWIVGQGGWDSMLDDGSESETDSELD